MAVADAFRRAVASLRLQHFCEKKKPQEESGDAFRSAVASLRLLHFRGKKSPKQDKEHRPNTSTSDYQIQYDDSYLSAVNFTDTRLKKVTATNCKWTNVTFTNCKLNNVQFHDVELKDVHFVDINFEHVAIKSAYLDSVKCEAHVLQHRDFTGTSALEAISYKLTPASLLLLDQTLSPRAAGETKSSNKAKCLSDRGDHTAEIASKTNQPKTAPKGLLDLSDDVLHKIARHLFPDFPIAFVDEVTSARDETEAVQTTYSYVKGEGAFTYRAKKALEVPDHGDTAAPVNLGLHPAFLRVNRRMYCIGVPLLYNRTLDFDDNFKACLAFLHDHQKVEYGVRSIRLSFAGPKSDLFRKIITILVHEQPNLSSFELTVREKFWDNAPWNRKILQRLSWHRSKSSREREWKRCVQEILWWKHGTDGETSRNFLRQIIRLPRVQSGHELRVSVNICGSDEDEYRQEFLEILRLTITQRRSRRSRDLAVVRGCHCDRKDLRKCCYWRPHERELRLKPLNFFDPRRADGAELPTEVKRRIMRHLFPMHSLGVMETPDRNSLYWPREQTRYACKEKESDRTTYIGWRLNAVETPKTSAGRGVPVAFLRVSKLCYRMGIRYLYNRDLHFDSNPATCLAFLHDHRRVEHSIRSITLHYDEKSSCNAWRRLFNAIVHSRPDLRSVTVRISQSFWEAFPWNVREVYHNYSDEFKGIARGAIRWKGWCNTYGKRCCQERSFLEHIARIPLRTTGGDDIQVEVYIDPGDDDCVARERFVRELQAEIDLRRTARPALASSEYGACVKYGSVTKGQDGVQGTERLILPQALEDSCYWEENQDCVRLPPSNLFPNRL